MEKPPRLEDFGLTRGEYDRAPRLLRDRLPKRAHTRIAVALGAFIGLWSLWGFFKKADTVFDGVFFGVLIGFVAFLLASFLGSMMIGFAIDAVSGLQRRLLGARDETARRAFHFDDALRNYQTMHAGDPGLRAGRRGIEE